MAPHGDREFAEYFAARMVPLRRLAYGMCGDWHSAEDLVQTTFFRLYQHWGRIRQESVDAYARRTLVNCYLSKKRDLRREHVVAEVPDQPSAECAPGAEVDLGRALAALPPRQRVLIILRYLEDVSVADAASALSVSEGTVKSQTARGLEKLRVVLGTSYSKEAAWHPRLR